MWRNLIFVSFPERQDEIGDLRLTESVLHETMHLHLTNEEERNPLVAHPERSLYSPWMETGRPVQGVLHGVFVFRCISAFFVQLTRTVALSPNAEHHIENRLNVIHQQLAEVDSSALERALTPNGETLVRRWAGAGR